MPICLTPRIDRCQEHELIDILTIAMLATICGAEHFTEMETFGEAKHDWLKTFLALKKLYSIPRHLRARLCTPETGGVSRAVCTLGPSRADGDPG